MFSRGIDSVCQKSWPSRDEVSFFGMLYIWKMDIGFTGCEGYLLAEGELLDGFLNVNPSHGVMKVLFSLFGVYQLLVLLLNCSETRVKAIQY